MMQPTLARSIAVRGGHDLFAVLATIESLDLPDIRFNARVLQWYLFSFR
jgi:hypothetical protein